LVLLTNVFIPSSELTIRREQHRKGAYFLCSLANRHIFSF